MQLLLVRRQGPWQCCTRTYMAGGHAVDWAEARCYGPALATRPVIFLSTPRSGRTSPTECLSSAGSRRWRSWTGTGPSMTNITRPTAPCWSPAMSSRRRSRRWPRRRMERCRRSWSNRHPPVRAAAERQARGDADRRAHFSVALFHAMGGAVLSYSLTRRGRGAGPVGRNPRGLRSMPLHLVCRRMLCGSGANAWKKSGDETEWRSLLHPSARAQLSSAANCARRKYRLMPDAVDGRSNRRRFSDEQKRAIVQETEKPGVATSIVFRWRVEFGLTAPARCHNWQLWCLPTARRMSRSRSRRCSRRPPWRRSNWLMDGAYCTGGGDCGCGEAAAHW